MTTQKQRLFTISDEVKISNEQDIACTGNDNWHQIGVDHVIDVKKKTKCSIRCDPNAQEISLMIGVTTKAITNMKKAYAGKFQYGYTFSAGGYMYNSAMHGPYHSKSTINYLGHSAPFCWAPNDVITVEFCDYLLTLYCNEVLIYDWKIPKYKNLEQVELIPVICTKGSNCTFLGVSEE